MTAMEKSLQMWSGERGFVYHQMLGMFIDGLAAPIYYIAGPPGVGAVMQALLVEAAISEASIRDEEFAGY